jgi:hypothetical protein
LGSWTIQNWIIVVRIDRFNAVMHAVAIKFIFIFSICNLRYSTRRDWITLQQDINHMRHTDDH